MCSTLNQQLHWDALRHWRLNLSFSVSSFIPILRTNWAFVMVVLDRTLNKFGAILGREKKSKFSRPNASFQKKIGLNLLYPNLGKQLSDWAGRIQKLEKNGLTDWITLSTALRFRPKFFWKWSFLAKKQHLLNNVGPFERILRALLIAQCPYKFSSFLDLTNGSSRFRLFARDFRLLRFFFSRCACFSKVAPPENL